MVQQNENTYLQAINYETILLAGHFSDARAVKMFERLRNWCDASASIGENIEAYKFITGCTENELFKAQKEVIRAFETLSPDTLIITNTDSLWCADIKSTLFLYLKGDTSLLKEKSISIVGTRSPSEEGVRKAKTVTDILGEKYVITSGLARGIDGVSHIEALAMGYRTIAVIGTPINSYYPPEHQELQDYIASHGLVVSGYSPVREVQQYFFIQRNQLMSEISFASVVIESGDAGGSVKQAKYTEKQGKDVFVFEDAYNDETLKWPREFKKPVVVPCAGDILTCVLDPDKFRIEAQPGMV